MFSLYSNLPAPKSGTEDEEKDTASTQSNSNGLLERSALTPAQSSAAQSSMGVHPTNHGSTPGDTQKPTAPLVPFMPMMRKPHPQAKAKRSKPVIPVGATVVTEIKVNRDALDDAPSLSLLAQTKAVDNLVPSVKLGNIPYLSTADEKNKSGQVTQAPKKKGKHKGKQQAQQPQQPQEGLQLDMTEDYDPTRPNDYEEYRDQRDQEKIQRRREEAARRRSARHRSVSSSGSESESRSRSPSRSRRQRRSRSRTPLRSRSPSRSSNPRLHTHKIAPPAERFENTSRRERAMSDRQYSPPPAPATTRSLPLDETGEEVYQRRKRLAEAMDTAPQASGPSSMAKKMLQKYGWKEGQELGRSKMDTMETDEAAPAHGSAPSKVILLTNMVGPGQVDDMLQEETAEECTKFGPVERCLVYEVSNRSVPDEQAVRIFVKFTQLVSAEKAQTELHGRYFGGRIVSARYFDCDRFDRLDLAPKESEQREA